METIREDHSWCIDFVKDLKDPSRLYIREDGSCCTDFDAEQTEQQRVQHRVTRRIRGSEGNELAVFA